MEGVIALAWSRSGKASVYPRLGLENAAERIVDHCAMRLAGRASAVYGRAHHAALHCAFLTRA